jgi:hypothetical protein
VSRRRPAAAAGLVLAALAAVLAPRFVAAGSAMDEGAVLAYATRILDGDVPMRDFQTFYGPLNPWLVAGVFKVFGPSLIAERAVGLAYRLVLAGAVLYLVRRRGPGAMACAGLVLALLLPGQGTWAWSSYGALAFVTLAVALADARRPALAGLAAGVAVLMRFDWILAVALASLPYMWAGSWRDRRRLAFGFVLGAGAYVPYLAVVGPSKVRLMLEQLRATEPGRHLPLPQWNYFPGDLLALTLAATALLLVLGVLRRRTGEGRTFLAGGLLGVATLPSVFARADGVHVVVAAAVPLALMASAAPVLVEEVRPVLARVRPQLRVLVLAAVGLFALSLVGPWLRDERYTPLLNTDDLQAYTVSHDGRSFRLANDATVQTAEAALRRTDTLTKPGDRVFVGPVDLRRTNYADSFLYYLLPRLRPASYYMELNPHTANRPGSGLAEQLRRADVLVLTTAYDLWFERNSSREYGSALPNRIVREQFCGRGTFGFYRVLERCRPA